ncbi:MAG: efflux RND transporter periplasmic adaptor subunit [Alphaproteobacteria bacterium]|nr:efflux RND transporter periplasmic adaptor subunit [Alphaproteobacteria bacterium]
MRAIWSYGVALLIIIVLGIWMFTGNIVIGGLGPDEGEMPVVSLIEPEGGPVTEIVGENQAEVHKDPNEPNPDLTIAERNSENNGGEESVRSVRVKTFLVAALPLEVTLRGRTKAKAVITAPAETTGIVQSVNVEKGQTVAVGDLLCTLDPSTRNDAVRQAQASLDQARAGLVQTQLSYDSNMALVKKGLAPANSAEQLEAALLASKSGVQSAETGLAVAEAELDRTEIRAKVAGVIQSPIADEGTMLAAGSPCATIAVLDPILFTGNVPEARISLAKTGLTAEVTTVSGVSAEGEVTYISSIADNSTRSFPIEIELPNPDSKILDGLSAEAKVNLGTVPAHLIPQSVLTLDDEGNIGVRAVDDGVVQFHEITIASDTRDGVWVLGLPPKVDVITIGQEFVSAGQKVEAAQSTEG